MSKYKIKIDRKLCIGAASCLAIAPNTFDLDGENIAVLKEGVGDDDTSVMLAAQSCPTRAIILEELNGEKVYPND